LPILRGDDNPTVSVEQLDEIWLKTESEIELTTDVYDKAISAFLKMARAQFFWDVNKRMGRFMGSGLDIIAPSFFGFVTLASGIMFKKKIIES